MEGLSSFLDEVSQSGFLVLAVVDGVEYLCKFAFVALPADDEEEEKDQDSCDWFKILPFGDKLKLGDQPKQVRMNRVHE